MVQVLIPVTEVQVKASTVKDMSGHYLWELIHLKSQVQRRTEKIYHLSNRSVALSVPPKSVQRCEDKGLGGGVDVIFGLEISLK